MAAPNIPYDGPIVTCAEAVKRCCRCKQTKPIDAFGRSKQSKDGIAYRCSECNRAVASATYRKNPKKARATQIAYDARRPEVGRAAKRKYYLANQEKWRGYCLTRRTKKSAAGGKCTAEDINTLMKLQKGKCAHPWCRVDIRKTYHVDHILPVASGGVSDRRNLQLLCPPCNRSKHAKHPIDFARKNGLLL